MGAPGADNYYLEYQQVLSGKFVDQSPTATRTLLQAKVRAIHTAVAERRNMIVFNTELVKLEICWVEDERFWEVYSIQAPHVPKIDKWRYTYRTTAKDQSYDRSHRLVYRDPSQSPADD